MCLIGSPDLRVKELVVRKFIRRALRFVVPLCVGRWFWVQRSRLVNERLLLADYFSDYRRYRKYSYDRFSATNDYKNLSAMIIMEAHAIEKGFSLPEIRSGFGVERISGLIRLLEQYSEAGFECKALAFQKAQSVLAEYLRYHEDIGFDLGERKAEISPWVDMNCDIGGYIASTREDLLVKAKGDFRECASSRYSIRSYSARPVHEGVIREAIELARKSPSVCNRQSWHVYIIKDEKLKERVLSLQNGNRGFGTSADFIAIVTSDIQSFIGPGERNEVFIDGGLYSMSLLYAFHYCGIGACPLNWMVHPHQDRELRGLVDIAPSENVIMMISAGYIPESVQIAKSVRKEVDDQVTFL